MSGAAYRKEWLTHGGELAVGVLEISGNLFEESSIILSSFLLTAVLSHPLHSLHKASDGIPLLGRAVEEALRIAI